MPISIETANDERHRQPAPRWRRKLIIVFGTLAVVTLAGKAALVETLRHVLPPPTGNSAVGRTTFYWTDPTRPEPNTPEADDRRALRVDVWYPAEKSEAAPTPYCPDFERLKGKLGLEKFVVGNVATHTLADPPVQPPPRRFAVVLFSPGNEMNAHWYTALVEELVSHGFVVTTVDHPYESTAIAYPDGRVVAVAATPPGPVTDHQAFERNYRDRVDRRAADLSFVLDRLRALDAGEGDTRFADRLDTHSVGVVGHSIGGIAAARAAQLDPRFQAAVNLDGHFGGTAFIPDEAGAGPSQPFLELCDVTPGPTDKQLAEWKTTREEFDRAKRRVDESMRAIAGGSVRVSMAGANHQTFSDNALWLPANRAERRRQTQIVRDFVRAFFSKSLLGNATAWTAILANPPQRVTVEQFDPR